jgi:hypothetical protein
MLRFKLIFVEWLNIPLILIQRGITMYCCQSEKRGAIAGGSPPRGGQALLKSAYRGIFRAKGQGREFD